MKIRAITGLLLVLMLASSCITKERCARFYPPQTVKADSVTVKVVEKVTDTLFEIMADSSWLKAWIECDSMGRATIGELIGYKAGQRAGVPKLTLRDNVLMAGCNCDSLKIHALLKSRETTIDRRTDKTITPPAVEVKYIPGWMWFFGISGMVAIGILVLYFGIKIISLKFF